MLYVGLDAHKSTSQITIMNEAGVILRRKRVHSTDEPFKAVLEASYSWEPMYDWLDDMSEEVPLAHPLKVRAIASARIKNDRIDSEVLAHLLRATSSRRRMRLRERFVLFGVFSDNGCSSSSYGRCFQTGYAHCWLNIPSSFRRTKVSTRSRTSMARSSDAARL